MRVQPEATVPIAVSRYGFPFQIARPLGRVHVYRVGNVGAQGRLVTLLTKAMAKL
ncbi:hypothetical protein [Mycobacterium sp. GA-1285]|uniref:hypothetical protein n=1 Tax=Mycobacterium sp. GA-1285 TaxID=1772282 RepID=UPI000AE2D7C8|nr:hypothetical protein [Mycobacterium sp. GA-1285]